MRKIRLGGMKAIEGRCLLSSLPGHGESSLAAICRRFAAERINISLLAHMKEQLDMGGIISICTDDKSGHSSLVLLKRDSTGAVELRPHIEILSVFPHNERAEVLGTFIKSLTSRGVCPYGFVSSPSAVSAVIPSAAAREAIDGLFEGFEFPTYKSPLDWYAAYQDKEQVFKEIICSYQEEMIRVYNISKRSELEMMCMTVPVSRVDGLASAFLAMGEMGIAIPFVTAQMGMREDVFITYCLSGHQGTQARRILDGHLKGVEIFSDGPITALYLHGPHFGDRYGIANALAASLQAATIEPMAVSCSVSSISIVISSVDESRCLEALQTRFDIPGLE